MCTIIQILHFLRVVSPFCGGLLTPVHILASDQGSVKIISPLLISNVDLYYYNRAVVNEHLPLSPSILSFSLSVCFDSDLCVVDSMSGQH